LIVTGDRVAKYVSEKIGRALCPPYTAMGIERDGEIVAGTVFNQFEGADVHVTVAGRRDAFSRKYLKAVGNYVFNQLGCIRMTIISEQPEVIQIATRLGAQTEGRIRNHFGAGRDGILLGILKEEWKFF
jgi:RimJ/RimL family protein N-acetyltransferase